MQFGLDRLPPQRAAPAAAADPPRGVAAGARGRRPLSLGPYDVVAVNLAPDADNRIHDDDVAQSFGFSGALVPGVEVFALATAPLVRAWGEAFLGGGRLSLRFRKPVYDGERVTVAVDGEAVRWPGRTASCARRGPSRRRCRPAAGRTRTCRCRPRCCPSRCSGRSAPSGCRPTPRPAPTTCAASATRCRSTPTSCTPGLLLRLVNLALMSNVALGPWIHTASDARFLSPARVDEDVEVRSRVTELFSRKGHDYVRYDALVLAGGRPVVEVRPRGDLAAGSGPGPGVAVLRPARAAVPRALRHLPGRGQVLEVAARADPRDAHPLGGLARRTGRRPAACSTSTTSAQVVVRQPLGQRRRT